MTGSTKSNDFPTMNPIQATRQDTPSTFVTTLNASGSALVFSTYLPGSIGCGVALDPAGNAYITGGGVNASPGFVYKIGAGPSYSVIGSPATVTAGTSDTITVTALNADGSVNTGYNGTIHFTSSDPQAVLPADAMLVNGTGTFSVILKTVGPAGSQLITVTDTSNSGISGSGSITVTPGAATHFVISAPTSIQVNTLFNLSVWAVDAYGNIATGYRGTIHFSDSVGGANLPGNYTFTATDKGVHTFTGLKLKTKGLQTITIFDVLNNTILGTFLINVT